MVLRTVRRLITSSFQSRVILSELRMRAPAQYNNVANHDEGGGVLQSSLKRVRKVKDRSVWWVRETRIRVFLGLVAEWALVEQFLRYSEAWW
jgi:hypothetical protein